MIQFLFKLLRDALWRDDIYGSESLPCELSEAEATELVDLAKKQAVLGLAIDALFRNNVKMPRKNVVRCVNLLDLVKQQVIKLNHGVIELHQLFSQEGVDYSIVKGQVVAAYYPDALLRHPGDIDYYCDSINFEKAYQLLKERWGITPEENDSGRHVCFDYDGVTFEGHYALLIPYGKKERAYWDQLLDSDKGGTVTVDGVAIRTLSPTIHTLFIFRHLYNHLINMGVGLRQFCDLAVMLHYAKEWIDMDMLCVHLKALGMEKAWRACGAILVDHLGMPEGDLGYMLSDQDRKYAKRILDVVLYSGNMGHYEGNQLRERGGRQRPLKVVGIKLLHFMKFAPLAPGYSCDWLWYEVKRVLTRAH